MSCVTAHFTTHGLLPIRSAWSEWGLYQRLRSDRIGLDKNMGSVCSIFVFHPENEAIHKNACTGQSTQARDRMSQNSIRHVRQTERKRVDLTEARSPERLRRMDKTYIVIIVQCDIQTRRINTRNWWLQRSETDLIACQGGLWSADDP